MSEINWQDDEAVVRAAIPDAQIGNEWGCAWCVYSNNLDGKVLGWDFNLKQKAWEEAREYSTVQAYERAHNPAFRCALQNGNSASLGAQVETPQLEEKVRSLPRFRCEHGIDSLRECPMCMAEAEPRLTEKQLSDFRRQWRGKRIASLAQEVYERRQFETVVEVRRRSEQ